LNPVNSRTARDLQLNRVIAAVAGYCRTDRGRLMVTDSHPLARIDDGRSEIAIVEEAVRLLQFDAMEYLQPVPAMDAEIAQVVKGGVLGNEELILFARTLQVAEAVRVHIFELKLRAPRLAQLFETTRSVSTVAERIASTFTEDGAISDDASPVLAELRAKVRQISRRVKSTVEEMLRDSQVASFVQDSYFTLREGRYVLPVKAEDYRFVPGIIHGTSQTGHTFFVEPSRIVDDNNALTVAADEIAVEEQAVRADRSRLIARFSGEIVALCDALWRTDSIVGRAEFARRLGRVGVAAPEIVGDDGHLVLKGAVNPILALQSTRQVVPIDIDMTPSIWGQGVDNLVPAGDLQKPLAGKPAVRNGSKNDPKNETWVGGGGGHAVVISGPNAGGKSVTLSTVGLCCLLVKFGILPPVEEGSRIPWYDHIFTVIGDPSDMDRSVSNFTGQLARVEEILKLGDRRTLVLIDELATGTEPGKGEALAAAIVEYLVESGHECLVATHYDMLKREAVADRRFSNVRVSVDQQTLAPTYRIEHGVVGDSNPFHVARSVGFPQRILDRAMEMTGQRERQLEEALAKANSLNAELLAERSATADLKARLIEDRRKYAEELTRLRKDSDRLVYQARQDVLRKMKALEDELERIGREVRAERAEATRREQMIVRRREEVKTKKAEIVGEIEKEAELVGDVPAERLTASEISVGQRVFVVKLRSEGIVTEVSSGGRKVEVQIGLLKTSAKLEDLRKPPKNQPKKEKALTGRERDRMIKSRSSGSELLPTIDLAEAQAPLMFVRSPDNTVDVRGMRVDEAMLAVEKLIDSAILNQEPALMVIHGMGTSALRKAVRDYLSRSQYVKSNRPGSRDEGGEGVTIVEMA